MTITKSTMKTLRAEIDAAVAEVAKRHGLHIKCGNGRFDSSNASFKLEINAIEGGAIVTKELAALREIKPEMENHEFTFTGVRYKVVGFRVNAPKKPYVVQRLDNGKTFVCARLDVELNRPQRQRS